MFPWRSVALLGLLSLLLVPGATAATLLDDPFTDGSRSNATGGDTLGAFVSAALGHLRALVRDGVEPPPSRIDGRLVGGLLVVDQSNGGIATSAPVANDPTIDTVVLPAADIVVRPFGATERLC